MFTSYHLIAKGGCVTGKMSLHQHYNVLVVIIVVIICIVFLLLISSTTVTKIIFKIYLFISECKEALALSIYNNALQPKKCSNITNKSYLTVKVRGRSFLRVKLDSCLQQIRLISRAALQLHLNISAFGE